MNLTSIASGGLAYYNNERSMDVKGWTDGVSDEVFKENYTQVDVFYAVQRIRYHPHWGVS